MTLQKILIYFKIFNVYYLNTAKKKKDIMRFLFFF